MAGEVRAAWQPLKEFTKEVFIQLGMPPGLYVLLKWN